MADLEASSGTGAATSRNVSEKSRVSGAAAGKGRHYDENYDSDFEVEEVYNLPTGTGISTTGGTSNPVAAPKIDDRAKADDEIRKPVAAAAVAVDIKKPKKPADQPDTKKSIALSPITAGLSYETAKNAQAAANIQAKNRADARTNYKPSGDARGAKVSAAAVNEDKKSL